MAKICERKLFLTAWQYCAEHHPDELEWAKSVNEDIFKNMKSKEFLLNYCWVVFASDPELGDFKDFFPELKAAFKDFDITALSKMRSIKPVLDGFDDVFDDLKQKAKCFLKGAKMIADEGFETYKKRLKKEGIDILEELPDIDSTTKSRLAWNIGFTDMAKPDKWLERAARKCKAASVDELVDYLSKEFNCSRHVVDFVLWRYEEDELEIDFAENYEALSIRWDL